MDIDALVIAPSSISGHLDLAAAFGHAAGGPVELELGFGKGRFLVAHARNRPDHRLLAVERSRHLVRKVRDRLARAGVYNVRLYHGDARDVVARLIPPASLARVHVYFPDPWPKRRHAKHRLFADPFPDDLARALAPRGELLLATDHDPYFREVVARLAVHGAYVRTTIESFADIPPGGFDALLGAQSVPILRACWQRTAAP